MGSARRAVHENDDESARERAGAEKNCGQGSALLRWCSSVFGSESNACAGRGRCIDFLGKPRFMVCWKFRVWPARNGNWQPHGQLQGRGRKNDENRRKSGSRIKESRIPEEGVPISEKGVPNVPGTLRGNMGAPTDQSRASGSHLGTRMGNDMGTIFHISQTDLLFFWSVGVRSKQRKMLYATRCSPL